MNECNTVVELARKVTIYNAIVNVKDGWDQLSKHTIESASSTFDGMFDATPITNEHQMEDSDPITQEPDKLLEVPWDEYLAFDDQLEIECPPRAPTASATPTDDHDQDDEIVENSVQSHVTIDNAIDQLKDMQKLFVDNDEILYSIITANKIEMENNKKNKQSTISDFFAKCNVE